MRWHMKGAAFVLFSCCVVVSVGLSCGFAGELIEPTRTLQEPGKTWGGLTIFSEPPQLDVYLDGEKVGRTPLWLREIQAGPHTLKIASAETSLRVDQGKRLKIGLFKGRFVTGSVQEKEKPRAQEPVKERGTVPASQEDEESQKSEDLSLWEKFVNGTLNHF